MVSALCIFFAVPCICYGYKVSIDDVLASVAILNKAEGLAGVLEL